MRPLRPSRLLLAAQVLTALAPAGLAAPEVRPIVLERLDFQGGTEDDVAFARAAAGFKIKAPVTELEFQTALAAMRETDRFRTVSGQWTPGPQGAAALVTLDPWPALERVAWKGEVPRKVLKGLKAGLRKGDHMGDRRLEAWRLLTATRLSEGGFPAAQVACARAEGARGLVVTVTLGPPALVRQVALEGTPGPYTKEKLLKVAGLKPGKTLWTQSSELECLRNLRREFQKRKRYEAQVDLAWDGQGTLRLTVTTGPVVLLKEEGDGLGWNVRLKDMVPVGRATRYSPELLDEGERRMVRFLRGEGCLDAQVSHRREVTRPGAGAAGPEEVKVTYTIRRGPVARISKVRFEGNRDLKEDELVKAAALPHSFLSPRGPLATPDLMDALANRVKGLYQQRGYTSASLRLQPLQHKDTGAEVVYRVYEGPRRMLQWLKVELPPEGFGDPWALGEALTLIFSDRPTRVPGTGPDRVYKSDRPHQDGIQGVLALDSAPGKDGLLTLTLTMNKPMPLLKSDLARVYTACKARLGSLGVTRPIVRLKVEDSETATGIQFEVPAQAAAKVQRLVVQGSSTTKAKAVLREAPLGPGDPLDLDTLSRAQARLSYLGAFQRVDLNSLADPGPDAPAAAGPPVPWKQGDLLLRLEERPPWVVTSSFGYDKSQGYHVGLGVQRLNFGGMGRTADFGIRAGDGTINNKTLRNMFPTGQYNRSVDAFTLGYTDPWFAPALLEGLLAERTQFRTEAAYIQEQRSLYLLRRRRFLNSLQWAVNAQVSLETGYRFERVEVQPAHGSGISEHDLSILARYPSKAIISAPYAQVVRDTRDSPLDPTSGSYSKARLEFATQLFLTSKDNSFVKLDLRHQWTWPVGYKASGGVVSLGLRVGLARPTASTSQNLPLSERFFAGGPYSHRGVEPDGLGPLAVVPLLDANGQPKPGLAQFQSTPLGGQGLALINLEYRFPIFGQTVWGEVFLDSGQVYERLGHQTVVEGVPAVPATATTLGTPAVPPVVSSFPPFRTALGLGLIFKIGVPIKVEYAQDVKRLLGLPRSASDQETQLRSLLISAGFQF